MKKEDVINTNSTNDLLSAFAGTQANQTVEILKELLAENNIKVITDLSHDQIKLATRIHIIAELKNLDVWEKGLEYYMKLLLSKDRKSRREILEAIKGSVTDQQGFFNRAMNTMRR